ncbi:MAG: AMP-binding protein [Bdellovibrionota bacterium]|mgnify:CR=1 FL=1
MIGYFHGKDSRNNVTTFLDEHIRVRPDSIALKWATQAAQPVYESVTIAELHDKISRTAAGFKHIGIGFGDRVILFVPMSLNLYIAMFALQKIGAIPVFLDSWARRDQLGTSAAIAGPKAMVSFEKAFDLCSAIPELFSIPIKICIGPSSRKYSGIFQELLATSEKADTVGVEQEDTALITFTTGSSGKPKGANRTHRFLAAQHYALDKCIPYTDADVDLPAFPIFSLNNLAAGVTTVIPAFDLGLPSNNDPEILLGQLESCKVSCTTLSPSLFNSLSAYCKEKGIMLAGLRRVVTGGAPVSRDNVINFMRVAPNAKILVLFGSTEVEPMADIEVKEMVEMKSRSDGDIELVDEGVNVGRIVDGLRCMFLKINKDPITVSSAGDWAKLEVTSGEVGELIVAGEHVCRNYYNDEEAFTRAKILDVDGTVWHRTGDLGRIDKNGYLWIVGRVHNAIQRKGRYCFPVRAEIVLKKLQFVKVAAYLGMEDRALGEKTICAVVPHDLSKIGDTDAESRWAEEIRRIMCKNDIPVDQIFFRKGIPLDPRHHSKVEYDILRKELMAAY